MTALAYDLDHSVPVEEEDRDLLHVCDLSILPVKTKPLRASRMIKNSKLESVIELFRDRESGSGQVDIEKLPSKFGWQESPPHEDFVLLRKIALIPSYDVYSLRVLLRAQGIKVDEEDQLKLSDAKCAELSTYMREFTRPLMVQVYGEEGVNIESFDDVVNLFRDPDVDQARRRLIMMAGKLGIDIMTIPKFLEDYADIFLSLSYYKQCLERVTPGIHEFLDSFGDLRKNYQMKNNAALMQACDEMEDTFSQLLASVTGRIESFERHTKDMWEDLSADRFRTIERIIKGYHTTMGGILCALTVKMNAWTELFPRREKGGPVRRSEFILSDIKHGMKRIRALEARAPNIAELSNNK